MTITTNTQERRDQLIANNVKKPGMRGKVNAKCIECIYEPDAGTGTWRQQVEGCTSATCPLYDIRPTSSGDKQ